MSTSASPRAPRPVASRPLPIRAEVGRQLRRRRTMWIGVLLVVLPLLLVAAFELGGADPSGTSFVDIATTGAGNFATFVLFASGSFLLVVLAALLAGDTVASEASWSSLRYLLAAPVPRSRLLRTKLIVALSSIVISVFVLLAVSLLVGRLVYGWHDVSSPTGAVLHPWTAVGRLAIAGAYTVVSLLWVAGFAFWLGTRTDAPLGAVGGAVMASILSSILDSITALGDLRVWLPTHEAFAWVGVLSTTPTWHDMAQGALVSASYALVALVAAWRHLSRKDITS